VNIQERLRKAVEERDWGTVLGIGLRAADEADQGNFCRCAEPLVEGMDLMCGECGLEVLAQRERRERQSREPHPWKPCRRGKAAREFGMCGVCTGWRSDPRHEEPAGGWTESSLAAVAVW
jgi:hypothetical protein